MRRLIFVIVLLGACAREEVQSEPVAFRGDALITRVSADAAREARVPRDVLLALGWAETRLTQRLEGYSPGENELDDAPAAPSDGAAATCGIFGLDEGATRAHAATLAGVTTTALCEQPDLEARAAALRLRELAGGEAAPPLDDLAAWLAALEQWHPQLAAIGFHYGDYVKRVLQQGFRGVDEVNASIYMPPNDAVFAAHTEVAGTAAAARPDTPLADWRGPSCEYSPASRTPGAVDFVIIHTCEGGFAGCLSTLTRCSSTNPVSAHYVTSYTGYTAQMVEENDVAWHVGCLNSRSIGIEHEGFAGAATHPDAQYCQTAKIVRSICDRWRIPCDRAHIIGHVEANRLYCHGTHWDPGPGWDWTTFMSYVARGGCGCVPSPEVCDGHDNNCNGAVDEGVTNACGTCGPAPTEVCNGRDDDCDGTVDENVCDRVDPHGDAPRAIDLGATVSVSLSLRNSGTTTWRPAHGYAFYAHADGATLDVTGGLTAAVAPGGSVDVAVRITPTREGDLGVHVGISREATPLVHEWSPAVVGQRPTFGATFVDVSLPLSIVAGTRDEGWAIVRNEGRAAWPAGTTIVASPPGAGLSVASIDLGGTLPGAELRAPIILTAALATSNHMVVVPLVVQRPDHRIATWPTPGPTQTITVRLPADYVPPPPPHALISGSCSATGRVGGAVPGLLLFLALTLVAARRRPHPISPRHARLNCPSPKGRGASRGSERSDGVRSLGVGLFLVLVGCAPGPVVMGAVPDHVSARGGMTVALVGHGLLTVTSVDVNGHGAPVVSRTDERLVVLVPPGAAGPAEVVAHVGATSVSADGVLTFTPLAVVLGDRSADLPADALESRDAVAVDFDRDGDLDVLMAVRGAPLRYLVNDGAGEFAPAAAGFLDAPSLDAIGLAVGDVDHDGDVDVYVPVYGRAPDLLLRNDGHGRLHVDAHALPADAESDHCAAFADLDGDGDLDLVVGVYGPDAAGHRADRVLANDGHGVFTIVARAVPPFDDRTAALALGDVDGDHIVDLVTANDGDGDVHVRVLYGWGDLTFVEGGSVALAPQREAARRVLLGDLDGDGDLDLVATGHGQDRLYVNDARGRFADATLTTMPSDDGAGDAAVLGDLDLDGDLDLFVGAAGEPERIYLNDGRGHMNDASALLPLGDSMARSALVADLDEDGAPDILVSEGGTRNDRLYGSGDPGVVPPEGAHGPSALTGTCSVVAGIPGGNTAGSTVALAMLLGLLGVCVSRLRGRS